MLADIARSLTAAGADPKSPLWEAVAQRAELLTGQDAAACLQSYAAAGAPFRNVLQPLMDAVAAAAASPSGRGRNGLTSASVVRVLQSTRSLSSKDRFDCFMTLQTAVVGDQHQLKPVQLLAVLCACPEDPRLQFLRDGLGMKLASLADRLSRRQAATVAKLCMTSPPGTFPAEMCNAVGAQPSRSGGADAEGGRAELRGSRPDGTVTATAGSTSEMPASGDARAAAAARSTEGGAVTETEPSERTTPGAVSFSARSGHDEVEATSSTEDRSSAPPPIVPGGAMSQTTAASRGTTRPEADGGPEASSVETEQGEMTAPPASSAPLGTGILNLDGNRTERRGKGTGRAPSVQSLARQVMAAGWPICPPRLR